MAVCLHVKVRRPIGCTLVLSVTQKRHCSRSRGLWRYASVICLCLCLKVRVRVRIRFSVRFVSIILVSVVAVPYISDKTQNE